MTNITVLKDDSLGGVEREYREVKREADVGERIKIVDAANNGSWGYDNGEVHTVISSDGNHEVNIRPDGTEDSEIYVESSEYVTLEPTNIVRINSARFRMVDRKAAVGERVIVVSDRMCHAIPPGVIGHLGHSDTFDYDNATYFVGNDVESDVERDYRVLEPLTSAEPAPLLSAQSAPDQAAELIAKLTTRVASLERRVTMLEIANAKPIPRRTAKPAQHPSFTKCAVKSPQEIRDDIVKRAKEDVAGLLAQNHPNSCVSFGVWLVTKDAAVVTDRVDFVVDREKRTVVALVTDIERKKVIGRGIAKCAPGDVFNSHIGRAIALRRALGLTVPAEYFEAPNPTEVRVGDYVLSSSKTRRMLIVTSENLRSGAFLTKGYAVSSGLQLVDDSRESDSAEPRKEVA